MYTSNSESWLYELRHPSVSWIPVVLALSVVLNVIGIGLETKLSDVTQVLRRPKALLRPLVAMNVAMPAIALLLWKSLDLRPAVGVVLVALSVSPVPPILPRRTQGGTGETQFAIALQVAAAVLTVVLLPLAAIVLERIFGAPVNASVAAVGKIVLVTILAPLAFGALVRYSAPRLAGRLAKPVKLVSTVVLLLSVAVVLVALWRHLGALIGGGTLAAMVVFATAGVTIGHLFGGPNAEERTVVALATASRHPGVALTFATANFSERSVLMAAILLYMLTAAMVTAIYLGLRRAISRRSTPKELPHDSYGQVHH